MIEGDILMYTNGKCDFSAFGLAVKEAREKRGWSRERLAQEVDLTPDMLCILKTMASIRAYKNSMSLSIFSIFQ